MSLVFATNRRYGLSVARTRLRQLADNRGTTLRLPLCYHNSLCSPQSRTSQFTVGLPVRLIADSAIRLDRKGGEPLHRFCKCILPHLNSMSNFDNTTKRKSRARRANTRSGTRYNSTKVRRRFRRCKWQSSHHSAGIYSARADDPHLRVSLSDGRCGPLPVFQNPEDTRGVSFSRPGETSYGS